MSQLNFETYGTVALLIDTSQSAHAYWSETCRVAVELYTMISKNGEVTIGFLGRPETVTIADLESLLPPQNQPCSLIAPNLEKLVQQRPIQAVIIVGNGEIFDIEDWIEHPLIDRWLLVQSGPDSLQGESRRLPQITSLDLDRLTHLLAGPSLQHSQTGSSSRRLGSAGAQQWAVDPTGYPLIMIEPLESWVQLFPITKPQFERFVAMSDQSRLGDEWYAKVLKLNPRISFRNRHTDLYERVLITGVTSDEAVSFGRWMGQEYSLFEADEWRSAYRWLASQSTTAIPLELSNQISADARAIWKLIEVQLQPRTLLELSLMSHGVIEWVFDERKAYVGLGNPRSSSPLSPPLREWFTLVKPIVPRPRDFGFRLHAKRG